jgi:hypothetical protein
MSSSEEFTIKSHQCLQTGMGNLYFHPFLSEWLMLRLLERDLSVLMWLQSGQRRELCESRPRRQVTVGDDVVTAPVMSYHVPDRLCVAASSSARATKDELLGAPHGEIRLSRKMYPPQAGEMLPLQIAPGRLHPLPHPLAGAHMLSQEMPSGLTISLGRAEVSTADGFQIWFAPQAKQKYSIADTGYVVGGMSLGNSLIPMLAYPCFEARLEWNSRVLDLRHDDNEQWMLGTGLESVTKTDEKDMIWLERK